MSCYLLPTAGQAFVIDSAALWHMHFRRLEISTKRAGRLKRSAELFRQDLTNAEKQVASKSERLLGKLKGRGRSLAVRRLTNTHGLTGNRPCQGGQLHLHCPCLFQAHKALPAASRKTCPCPTHDSTFFLVYLVLHCFATTRGSLAVLHALDITWRLERELPEVPTKTAESYSSPVSAPVLKHQI